MSSCLRPLISTLGHVRGLRWFRAANAGKLKRDLGRNLSTITNVLVPRAIQGIII